MDSSGARFEIRPALPGDAPLLCSLIRELAEFEKLGRECVATEELLREHLFGPNPAAEALLGFAEGEPFGYALFFRNFSTFTGRPGLYLEDLYVRPARRRRGYGTALFLRVARLAVERNCGRFEWTVLGWNEPAIRFYEALGAARLDGWRAYRLAGDALGAAAAARGAPELGAK